MAATNRIVSVETQKVRPAAHEVIVAVRVRDDDAADEQRLTVRTVLQAMDNAERFYSEGSNGRRARVQRFTCSICRQEHIRTHLTDAAIHNLTVLPKNDVAATSRA